MLFMTLWALLIWQKKWTLLKCMSIKYWISPIILCLNCQRKCFTLDLVFIARKFHLKSRCWKMQKHSTHIQKPFLNLATVLSFLSKWDAKLWKLRVIISLELQLEKHPPWKENHDHMFEFYDTISYYNQWKIIIIGTYLTCK